MIAKAEDIKMGKILRELQELQKYTFGIEDFLFQIDTANFKEHDNLAIFVHVGLYHDRNFYDFYSFEFECTLQKQLQKLKDFVSKFTSDK